MGLVPMLDTRKLLCWRCIVEFQLLTLSLSVIIDFRYHARLGPKKRKLLESVLLRSRAAASARGVTAVCPKLMSRYQSFVFWSSWSALDFGGVWKMVLLSVNFDVVACAGKDRER
jgi:hypothetical protein